MRRPRVFIVGCGNATIGSRCCSAWSQERSFRKSWIRQAIAMSEKVRPKTIRELIDLCNSLPRGRRIVGYVSTLGFFLFVAALGVAVYFKTGFFTYLVLALCLFLSTAHSNYALDVNLTQRKVRRIDYWYVGAATIGMLWAVASYSHQRNAVITRVL